MSLSQQTLIQKEQELNTRLQQSLTDMSKAPDFSETNKKLDETLRENLDLHHRWQSVLLQWYGTDISHLSASLAHDNVQKYGIFRLQAGYTEQYI